MLENVIGGLQLMLSWPAPLYLVLGVLVGSIFGVLPGLGGPQVLALLIPLTYGMNPSSAMVLLIAAMAAVPCSGSVTAILLNTPGSGQNAATIIDGYPLTCQGKAGMAIGAAATASALGALVGVVVLMAILPIGRYIILAFSYPEYFMMGIIAFVTISVVSQGAVIKSLVAAGLGLILTCFGFGAVTGAVRFAFGTTYLWDGIQLVPAVVGLFAVSISIELFVKESKIAAMAQESTAGVLEGVKAVFRHFFLFLRCSLIGTVVGIIPGVGASVAIFAAYGHAVQTAKNKELFGKGDIRGVIAPESANNAKDGGSLVPTLIFGIPGSIETAVFLGALTLHGLEAGPKLMLQHGDVVLVVVLTLVLANLMVSGLVLAITKPLILLSRIPSLIMAPLVLSLSLLAAYATRGNYWDMVVALIFGIFGYLMKIFRYSPVPLTIALVLGNLLQLTFAQTLTIFGWQGFFSRPYSLIMFLITLLMLFGPLLKSLLSRPVQTRKMEPLTSAGMGVDSGSVDRRGRAVDKQALLFALALLAFCVLIASISLTYDPLVGRFPLMVSLMTMALLLAGIGMMLARDKGSKARDDLQAKWGRAGEFLLWAVIFVVLLNFLSVWLILPVFVFLFLKFASKQSWQSSVFLGAGMGGALFLLFKVILDVTF